MPGREVKDSPVSKDSRILLLGIAFKSGAPDIVPAKNSI